MDSKSTDGRDQGNTLFEQSLEQFLLNAYTDGHEVAGEWQIAVPISDAPDWEVTITKSYPEESSSYQPTILEE